MHPILYSLIFFVIIMTLAIPMKCDENVVTKEDLKKLFFEYNCDLKNKIDNVETARKQDSFEVLQKITSVDQKITSVDQKITYVENELKIIKERLNIISMITSAVIYTPIFLSTNLIVKVGNFFKMMGSFMLKIKVIRNLFI